VSGVAGDGVHSLIFDGEQLPVTTIEDARGQVKGD
jgi:hypothetical protein